jgi:nucleotide-binding universal stress UspA family protein
MQIEINPAPERHTAEDQSPTIVVGYDGSQEAREAVAVAAQRAGPDGTVVIVHARPSPSEWLDTARHEWAAEEYQRRGDEVLSAAADWDLGGPAIATELVDGKPADALIREARRLGAREIVVGSRGFGRLRGALGSVSQALLRDADRPVVVVPRRAARDLEPVAR